MDLKNRKSPEVLTGLTDVSKILFAYGTKEYLEKKNMYNYV